MAPKKTTPKDAFAKTAAKTGKVKINSAQTAKKTKTAGKTPAKKPEPKKAAPRTGGYLGGGFRCSTISINQRRRGW